MVEPAHIRAPRRIALGLVLQGRAQLSRSLIPLGLVIKLDHMTVGIVEAVRRPMTEFVAGPADSRARSLDRFHSALECLRTSRPKGGVAQGCGLGGGQLKRILFVIIPCAKKDRIALAPALRHAHDIDEEAQALIRPRREKLEVTEMRHVHDGLVAHGLLPEARSMRKLFQTKTLVNVFEADFFK